MPHTAKGARGAARGVALHAERGRSRSRGHIATLGDSRRTGLAEPGAMGGARRRAGAGPPVRQDHLCRVQHRPTGRQRARADPEQGSDRPRHHRLARRLAGRDRPDRTRRDRPDPVGHQRLLAGRGPGRVRKGAQRPGHQGPYQLPLPHRTAGTEHRAMAQPTAGPWPPPGTPGWPAPHRRSHCRPKPPISTSSTRAGAESALEVWPCMHHSRLVMAALLPEGAEAAGCEPPRSSAGTSTAASSMARND